MCVGISNIDYKSLGNTHGCRSAGLLLDHKITICGGCSWGWFPLLVGSSCDLTLLMD